MMKLHRFLIVMAAALLIPCLSYADTSTDQASQTATTAAPSAAPAAAPASDDTGTLFGNLLKKYNINPTGSVTLDYFSRYVWRGQYLDRDGVLEPGISLSANGFTFGYWSNWDMVNDDPLHSNESDYYASYAYTYGILTLTGGNTWYGFPGTNTSSKEFFVSAGLNTFLSPVFTVYHDYEDGKDLGHGNGNYYSLAISNTMDVYKPWGVSLTLGATLGYIDHQWLNGTGFHFTPTLALNLPITKSLTISPTIGYNITQGDLRDTNIGNTKDAAFGGVHSVVTF